MLFKEKIRKVYILLLIFYGLTIFPQSAFRPVSQGANVNGAKCLTKLPPNYLSWRNNILQTQNLVTTLKHDTCLNKKFSIVFYVVLDSLAPPTWGGIGPSNLIAAVDSLNNKFKKICVSFQSCSTVVIHNYVYNQFVQVPHEVQITSNWYTTQTLNIYLVTNVAGGTFAGYTYMPGTPGKKDVIFMRKNALNTKILYHLIGHFFGLPDTFGEISNPSPVPSMELVARTNCYTNGDGFCDTEADSYPTGNAPGNPQANCDYLYGPTDAQTKFYTPPLDNYMNEYPLQCRCKYTQEQYNFMARVMITSKFYLH